MAETQDDAVRRAEEFNAFNPVGTCVLAFPGVRGHNALVTRTRTPAWALPSGDAVVMVDDHAGGIALTHVDVLPTDRILRLSMMVNAHQAAGSPWRCSCGWDDPDPKTHALHLGEHLDGLVDELVNQALAPARVFAAVMAAECAYEGSHDTCPGHALQRLLEATA